MVSECGCLGVPNRITHPILASTVLSVRHRLPARSIYGKKTDPAYITNSGTLTDDLGGAISRSNTNLVSHK